MANAFPLALGTNSESASNSSVVFRLWRTTAYAAGCTQCRIKFKFGARIDQFSFCQRGTVPMLTTAVPRTAPIHSVELCTHTRRSQMHVNTERTQRRERERDIVTPSEPTTATAQRKQTNDRPTRSESFPAVRSERCDALCICTFLFTCKYAKSK